MIDSPRISDNNSSDSDSSTIVPRLTRNVARYSNISVSKIQYKDMKNMFHLLVKIFNNEQSSMRKVYSTMNDWIHNIRRWKDVDSTFYFNCLPKMIDQNNILREGLPLAAVIKPLHQTKLTKRLKSIKEIGTSPKKEVYQIHSNIK